MAEGARAKLTNSIADLYATWQGRTEVTDIDIVFAKLVMDLVADYMLGRTRSESEM